MVTEITAWCGRLLFHTCVVVLEVKNGDKSVVSTFDTCVLSWE